MAAGCPRHSTPRNGHASFLFHGVLNKCWKDHSRPQGLKPSIKVNALTAAQKWVRENSVVMIGRAASPWPVLDYRLTVLIDG